MNSIEIVGISEELFQLKGFDEKGCFGSDCQDACCRKGCDVDKESYGLIMQYRRDIEAFLEFPLEDCFEKVWSDQIDFLGGGSIRSSLINGSCSFHIPAGKGCVLFRLITERNYPKKMLPSICRLYPVTWDKRILCLEKDIEKTCNCLDPHNPGTTKLWDTQKEAIEDIFIICPPESLKGKPSCKNQ